VSRLRENEVAFFTQLDGLEVARTRSRRAVTLPDAPIILAVDWFTECRRAFGRPEIVRRALNRGANDVYKWPDLMHCWENIQGHSRSGKKRSRLLVTRGWRHERAKDPPWWW